MQPPIQGEKIEILSNQINLTTITGWNSEKRQLYQIEAGVLAGFIIMFIQLIFGLLRRKSTNSFVQFLLWLANSTSYFVVATTLGMMVSSPFKNDELLAVWAICLFMVLVGTENFTTYSLEDNESWKKQYIQLCLTGLQKCTKVIADHMKRLHEHNQQGQLSDPTCMEGYHYLVTGEEELQPMLGSHTIPIDVNEVKTITVEKVWKCKGTLLNNVRDPDGKLKDICLSFALFKMLRRRFSGHPFAECQDQQTKDFVFKGLISELGDFKRAFRVVEENPWIEGALRVLCRVPSGKRWQNRLGQYSLFKSFDYQPKCSAVPHYLSCSLVDKKRKGQKEPWFVGIPDSVKGEIISALKLTNGYEQMTNGITSLVKNGVSTNLSWACSFQSDTETILVWHVATSLCEINKTGQQYFDHITVANCLSKYCAYLVAFAPELLPDNKYDSEVIFDNAIKEAKILLKGTSSMKEIYEELIILSSYVSPSEAGFASISNTVLKGAALATQLINLLDEPMRWQVLAEFWAEMILYITPSDNATDHLKHLTKGGEFLTQLWTLFSHAGILERLPKTNRVAASDGARLKIVQGGIVIEMRASNNNV